VEGGRDLVGWSCGLGGISDLDGHTVSKYV
jgi:hypothetical protein